MTLWGKITSRISWTYFRWFICRKKNIKKSN